MRRALTSVLAAAMALVVSGCGSGEVAPSGIIAADTQTRIEQTIGEVTMIVILDPDRPESFTVAFDTHTVDLAFDVAQVTTLSVDGGPSLRGSWDGTPPGGHHRMGTMRFPVSAEPGQTLTLTFEGLEDPAVVTWTLPG